MGALAWPVALGLAAAVLTPAPVSASPVKPAPASPGTVEVVGLVVTRERGTSAEQVQRLVVEEVGEVQGRDPVAPGVTAIAVEGLSAADAGAAVRALREHPGIAEVGIDSRVSPEALPNDPLFPEQWSLDPGNVLSGIDVVPVWGSATGSGRVIAVIDSGITAHPDLDDHVLDGYDMVSEAVTAHDGDGRDSDPADTGDWLTSEEIQEHPEVFGGCVPQAASSWHGTHVAGLAAALRGNNRGIAGVAPGAWILPVRALGKCGGAMSDVAAAVTWASGGDVPGVPTNPTPADVINLSLSSTLTCQPFVQAAIDGALERGASVVAAAGNAGVPHTQSSPGGCYDVLAVGAVDRQGKRAPYSNFGVAGRDLPVFAPGGLRSTGADAAMLSTVNLGSTVPQAAGYGVEAGTSMASALVSGAAALLRERTGMSAAAVAEQLRDTARPFPSGSNCTGSCGAGILDVRAALTTSPRMPGQVGEVRAMPSDAAVALSWDAPTDAGDAPITGYDVHYRTAGGSWTPVTSIWPSTLRERIVGGLANDLVHQFRIAARSDFGLGPWRESGPVTPRALPGPVEVAAVTYPTKTSADLDLVLPGGGFDGLQYRLSGATGASTDWYDTPTSPRLTLTGLLKGRRTTVEVRAFNVVGAGPTSSRLIATPVKPSGVRGLRMKRRGAKLVVSWREPVRTGLSPRYRIRADGRAWQRTAVPTATLRGARRITRVEVQARNEIGFGPVVVVRKRK